MRGRAGNTNRPTEVKDVELTLYDTVYFTDGASKGNPGSGAYAVIKNGALHQCVFGGFYTTNNRMEGLAIASALRDAATTSRAIIVTDSSFWVTVLTQWVHNWARNDWTKRDGSAISNLDVVQDCYELMQAKPQIVVRWVRAHQDDSPRLVYKHNAYADKCANAAHHYGARAFYFLLESSGAVGKDNDIPAPVDVTEEVTNILSQSK